VLIFRRTNCIITASVIFTYLPLTSLTTRLHGVTCKKIVIPTWRWNF